MEKNKNEGGKKKLWMLLLLMFLFVLLIFCIIVTNKKLYIYEYEETTVGTEMEVAQNSNEQDENMGYIPETLEEMQNINQYKVDTTTIYKKNMHIQNIVNNVESGIVKKDLKKVSNKEGNTQNTIKKEMGKPVVSDNTQNTTIEETECNDEDGTNEDNELTEETECNDEDGANEDDELTEETECNDEDGTNEDDELAEETEGNDEDGTNEDDELTEETECMGIKGKIITENLYDVHIATITIYNIEYEENGEGNRIIVKTIITNQDGTFTIDLPEEGMYDLVISKAGYLTHTILKIEIQTEKIIKLEDKKLIAGDVNGDGVIGLEDVSLISSRNGAKIGSSKYNEKYDFNADEVIDVKDRDILRANYDKLAIVEQWEKPEVED